ncbi:protein SHI RELATED SEQUENCE 6-like [Typha latifolia]|uniref:protein SHI RELATED SEQUENCE 6-like n=1 Tax=Typha latifolia TaxID=4733 RepID=UPI003C2E3C5C
MGMLLVAPPPPPSPLRNPNPSPNTTIKPIPLLDTSSILVGGGVGFSTCEDCGNQAKKDCRHRRCRTCCNGRGFACSTHVNSTWVPAARRRERQLTSSSTKRPRLLSSQATTTTTNSHTSTSTDSSLRKGLPGQVTAPAVFKCVQVTSVDDGGDEYAYQAAVTIGGHVFKGLLYDHGVDDNADTINNNNATTTNSNNNNNNLDVSELSGSGFLGGIQFGNLIN